MHNPTSVAASRRRLLLLLATLVAAVAIATTSGATFSSTSANTASLYATGTLTQSNSKADQAIFSATNLKPGDTVNGTVTVTNTGTLPATFTITELNAQNTFVDQSKLTVTVTDTTANTVVYSGLFPGLGSANLGTWAAGEAHTFVFSVTLDLSATNDEQGKSASAEYRWDAIQADNGQVYNQ